jgi:hypothetical protein
MNETVHQVVSRMWADPRNSVIRRWNWKSALFGAAIRGMIFFLINRTSGRALIAMFAEFLLFVCISGFFGAVTQNFRHARPWWLARLAVIMLVIGTTHSIEFVLHNWVVDTPRAVASSIASTGFTILSTTFSFFVMRRGAMVIGADGDTFGNDMKRMPLLVFRFVTAPLKLLFGPKIAD